jgi:hypothetical protein
MSQYDNLDMLIVAAVEQRRSPLYERSVNAEAQRIARVTGREVFRIVDGRLQALRKRGAIVHLTKAEGAGSGGWKITHGMGGPDHG